MAANGLRQSNSYLGAQYRRLRSKLDTPCANKAMANKLARLIYRVMKFGQEYVDKGAQSYEEAFRRRQILAVAKRAAGLGFQPTERSDWVGYWRELAAGFSPLLQDVGEIPDVPATFLNAPQSPPSATLIRHRPSSIRYVPAAWQSAARTVFRLVRHVWEGVRLHGSVA